MVERLRRKVKVMAKTGDYQIPFHPVTGDQMHYPDPYIYESTGSGFTRRIEIDWRDNHSFEDKLTYSGFSRGRSSAYISFVRLGGEKVTVFMKEMDEMIPYMIDGQIRGRFTFIKRGANFGCRLLQLA